MENKLLEEYRLEFFENPPRLAFMGVKIHTFVGTGIDL